MFATFRKIMAPSSWGFKQSENDYSWNRSTFEGHSPNHTLTHHREPPNLKHTYTPLALVWYHSDRNIALWSRSLMGRCCPLFARGETNNRPSIYLFFFLQLTSSNRKKGKSIFFSVNAAGPFQCLHWKSIKVRYRPCRLMWDVSVQGIRGRLGRPESCEKMVWYRGQFKCDVYSTVGDLTFWRRNYFF